MHFFSKYHQFIVFFIGFGSLAVVAWCDTGILLDQEESDPSWQWGDTYTLSSGTGWSRDSTAGSYVVCDIIATKANHTNSWLVSEIIQSKGAKEITISVTFTARECPSNYTYCVTYIRIFVLQTNALTAANKKQAIMEGNFTLISNAIASSTWTTGQSPIDNVVSVTQVTTKSNILIAFQDIGSCVAVKRVSVTYRYCPYMTFNGVTFNKTMAPALRDKKVFVTGSCLENSSEMSGKSSINATCMPNGDWLRDNSIVCQCKAGYEMFINRCQECPAGKYKPVLGNHACTNCPDQSSPSLARDHCPCRPGFYRTTKESQNISCSAPPSAPRDLQSTIASTSIVSVIWNPPIDNGGRHDVKYDVICTSCDSGVCQESCSGVNYWPANENLAWCHVTISNLLQSTAYKITIQSKNGVSSIATIGYHANQSLIVTIPALSSTTGKPSSEKPSNKSKVYMTSQNAEVSLAIGLSVACTTAFFLLVGLPLACIVIRKYSNRTCHVNDSLSRPYTRKRNQSNMTSMTELTAHRSTPTTDEIQEINMNEVYRKAFDHKPKEMKQQAWSPRLDHTNNQSKTRKDYPHINIDKPRDQSRDSTQWAANGKAENKQSHFSSSASVRSWFPPGDVQYGI